MAQKRPAKPSNKKSLARAGGGARMHKDDAPPMPTWMALTIGLLTGAIMGALTMAVVWLAQPSECPPLPEVKACPEPALVAPPLLKPRAGEDFYRVLPQAEIKLPAAEPSDSAEDSEWIYTLQVGALRDIKDADAQVAELALLGFEARIASSTSSSGTTWHRINIGPFTSKREAERVKRLVWERARLEAIRKQQRAP